MTATGSVARPFTCTLVVATIGDGAALERCLASIADQQDAPKFDVVIIDQSGGKTLDATVARYADRLQFVHHKVQFRNASRARNLGASLARGAWVGFPDDDCELLPDALSALERVASDTVVRVVTGQTLDPQGRPNLLRWPREPTSFTRWNMFGCLTEATLFVDRDLFLASGGFDESFGPGAPYPAAEGIELMNRLFQRIGAGQARYSPTIRMRHPTKVPPWNARAVQRFRAYASGDGALIAKSPQPHMLYWGARTAIVALVHALRLDGWRSRAFAARLAGLAGGFVAYTRGRFSRSGKVRPT